MAASEAIAVSPTPAPVMACPDAWRAVLEASGARIEGAGVIDYGDAATETATVQTADAMADLSHFGLIAVDGPDAQKFLSSLFTGEIRQVSPSLAQFTSWCDGKGRMQVTFWLFMRGDTYYLLMPSELLAPTLTRLKQFLLRSKATIRDASSELVRIGLSGPGIQSRLMDLLSAEPPAARGETLEVNGCVLIAIPGAQYPRWLLAGALEPVQAVWSGLKPEASPVGAEAWSLLDILAKLPFLQPATAGEFIPQMLDLEALGGLSFKKGCYPGQEVVARLQYRGQLKRKMYAVQMEGEALPSPGTKLYGTGTSESVGMVLAASKISSGLVAMQAVVVIEQQAQGEIWLGEPEGPKLVFQDLDMLQSAESV